MKIGLKMKELSKITGVSNSTILYYISLGLLPEPIKTSRNMAYYPDSYLRIIPVIRYLKENMHLPLETIKRLFENIGYDNISIEDALHYYETFFRPLDYKGNMAGYDRKEFVLNTRLEDTEITELESREMIFPSVSGQYYYEDLLTAKAYKALNDYGISFASIERLSEIIKKLANEVHEIYHEHEWNSNSKEEIEFTRILQKELDTIIHYLMNKYCQEIFKNEIYK